MGGGDQKRGAFDALKAALSRATTERLVVSIMQTRSSIGGDENNRIVSDVLTRLVK